MLSGLFLLSCAIVVIDFLSLRCTCNYVGPWSVVCGPCSVVCGLSSDIRSVVRVFLSVESLLDFQILEWLVVSFCLDWKSTGFSGFLCSSNNMKRLLFKCGSCEDIGVSVFRLISFQSGTSLFPPCAPRSKHFMTAESLRNYTT